MLGGVLWTPALSDVTEGTDMGAFHISGQQRSPISCQFFLLHIIKECYYSRNVFVFDSYIILLILTADYNRYQ